MKPINEYMNQDSNFHPIQLNEYLNIDESVTKLNDINNYGKTWTTEHDTIEFEDMIKNFLNGALAGLEENLKAYEGSDSDISTIESDTKLVKKLLDIIDHPVMWNS